MSKKPLMPKKPRKPTKLELTDVFQFDANEIIESRAKGKVIHKSGNIRTSGDEVEEPVRRVIRRKLPTSYYVGQGHIIDSRWNLSPQVDVVISDNFKTPVLFRCENNSEYFPYESVYAIGEVKSSYVKSKKYIETFIESIKTIKTTLVRNRTELIHGEVGNPLFCFMLFADAGDFSTQDIDLLFRTTKPDYLPNMLCFLNSGVAYNCNYPIRADGKPAGPPKRNVYPESNIEQAGRKNCWMYLPMGATGFTAAGNFATFYYTLLTHLSRCTLETPDLSPYLKEVMLPDKIRQFWRFG